MSKFVAGSSFVSFCVHTMKPIEINDSIWLIEQLQRAVERDAADAVARLFMQQKAIEDFRVSTDNIALQARDKLPIKSLRNILIPFSSGLFEALVFGVGPVISPDHAIIVLSFLRSDIGFEDAFECEPVTIEGASDGWAPVLDALALAAKNEVPLHLCYDCDL